MKNICIIVFFLFSIHSLAMDSIDSSKHISVKGKSIISRVDCRKSIFDYTKYVRSGGQEFTALAVETFYRLFIDNKNGNITRTSPVKHIEFTGNEYVIQTISGTFYHVTKLSFEKDFDSLKKFFVGHTNVKTEKICAMPIYQRKELQYIKEQVKSGQILAKQNYETWSPYKNDIDGDKQIFKLNKDLKNMQKGDTLELQVPDKDDLQYLQ